MGESQEVVRKAFVALSLALILPVVAASCSGKSSPVGEKASSPAEDAGTCSTSYSPISPGRSWTYDQGGDRQTIVIDGVQGGSASTTTMTTKSRSGSPKNEPGYIVCTSKGQVALPTNWSGPTTISDCQPVTFTPQGLAQITARFCGASIPTDLGAGSRWTYSSTIHEDAQGVASGYDSNYQAKCEAQQGMSRIQLPAGAYSALEVTCWHRLVFAPVNEGGPSSISSAAQRKLAGTGILAPHTWTSIAWYASGVGLIKAKHQTLASTGEQVLVASKP